MNSGSDPSLKGGFAPKRMLVKFRKVKARSSVLGREIVNMRKGQSLPILARQTGVSTTVLDTFDGIGVTVLEINSSDTVDHSVKAFSELAEVEYAEPDYLYQLHDIGPRPTDTFFDNFASFGIVQWGMDNDGAVDIPGNANYPAGITDVDSRACDAWVTATTKGAGVVVCVIDTGLNTTHVDFANNLWTNPGETVGDRIDNDGNGYVDDINGINPRFDSLEDGVITDQQGHGSNVAGIAMAAENGVSCVGVAPQARVMTIKTGTTSTAVELSAVIKGVEYATAQAAASQNVRVINMSLGGSDSSRALKDAIDAAAEENILCVVSSGNNNQDLGTSPQFPAAFTSPNIITVGAHTPDDRRSGFSNFGDVECDIFAPGGDSNGVNTPPTDYFILGPTHSNTSGASLQAGTSQASPHVAGAAALLYANTPGISYSEVRKKLMQSAVSGAGNYAGLCLSGGRLDANAALTASTASTIFLDGASPSGGHTDTQVVLEGVGFGATQGAGKVEITVGAATVNATIVNWSENKVHCTVPAGVNTGVGTIRVVSNGAANSNTVPFTTNGAAIVYEVTQVTHAPIDISAVTPTPGLSGLTSSSVFGLVGISFPIDFLFYGANMRNTTLVVSGFGHAQFDTTTFTVNNTSLPTSAAPNSIVAALWGRLHPTANTQVRIGSTATSLIIEWKNVGFGLPLFSGVSFLGTAAIGEGTFQLEFQNDNDILMHYIDVDFGHPDGDGGSDLTVGVENSSGTEGTQWNQPVTNGMSLQFRPK